MSTHYTQNGPVPVHRYGLVSREILTGMDAAQAKQFEKCVIFGITSVPSRALMFSILCESGAQWARIPLHMLRHEAPAPGAVVHPLHELQMWDNHGWEFSVVRYEYLRDMACVFRKRDGSLVPASYWFTLDHTDNGWSLYPPEHKCYHLLLLEDGSGQIAAQPNNRIRWKDDSFTDHKLPLDYRVMAEDTWHAEVSRVNAQDSAFTVERVNHGGTEGTEENKGQLCSPEVPGCYEFRGTLVAGGQIPVREVFTEWTRVEVYFNQETMRMNARANGYASWVGNFHGEWREVGTKGRQN